MRATELKLDGVDVPLGPVPKRFTNEYLCDPKVMADLLYRTSELTDEAFYEIVDDIGSRAARLVLRGKALAGDVKALDLYHRITKEEREERKRAKRPAERQVNVGGFIQPPRPQDVDQ